ncbi:MAG: UDP-N-acetylmuramate dehydrogenase [Spirochaetes bacterium]|nr:UDP-N-acetylmuramate dehydrogenase [Spirochaetota bacterium]
MSEKKYAYLEKYGIFRYSAPMNEYTSFKCGGPADFLITPAGYDEASEIIKYCVKENINYTVIGAGSNLLVGDKGIRGAVIRISEDMGIKGKIEIQGEFIYCDASVKKTDFIDFAVDNGFGGVEFAVGIPGSIGGGISMNAGTFMGTYIDILKKIRYIDKSGNLKVRDMSSTDAHYRHMDLDDAVIITGGYFMLPRTEDAGLLRSKIEDIINDRKFKHPWTYPSAGSVFKNPDGHQSWKLVNDSGLKGFRIGDAMVSELHTNFIINDGNAKAADIRRLIELIQKTVKEKFNVDMHTEIKMIGEF